MAVISQKVTIFIGSDMSKRLAKSFEVETPSAADKFHLRIRFMERHARKVWWYVEARSKVVVVDGWDHPEFDELQRGVADAPVEQLSAGVSVRMASTTIMRGGETTRNKYQLEFEEYLKNLELSLILFDTWRTSAS